MKNKDDNHSPDEIEVIEESSDEAQKDSKEIVSSLKEKLKIAEKERLEYLQGWQRAKADYANQEKEHAKSKAEFVSYADTSFFEDLQPALDSFAMAFSNKEAWEKAPKDWRIGIEYIYTQIIQALRNHNIEPFVPNVGDKFDPKEHSASESVASESEKDDHKIMRVIKQGYKMKDRILRPADVVIGEYKKS
jgi:molecular chaperone GrpE